MSYMSYQLLIFVVIILILSSTSTYAPPIIEQDIGSLYCQNGESLLCCPHLARRVATKHHSRCSTIVLINNSGYNMRLSVSDLEDGRWVTKQDYDDNNVYINCEPQTVPLVNGASEAFSSVTSHFFGGIRGFATFAMDDDNLSNFTISWKVPTIGSPRYSIDGLSKEKYEIKRIYRLDDTVFQVTVDQYHPWSVLLIFPPFLFLPFCCVIVVKDKRPIIYQQIN